MALVQRRALAVGVLVTCSILDCDRSSYVRGWCTKHYQRWLAHGDPLRSLNDDRPRVCTVDDCYESVKGHGLCEKHYMRAWRHEGDVTAGEGRYGSGWPAKGYVSTARTGHPLARAKGQVQMHRLVLFHEIGEGPHRCHWCHRSIAWTYGMVEWGLVVDHVDGDGSNNDPANLVPSCQRCNTWRAVHPETFVAVAV